MTSKLALFNGDLVVSYLQLVANQGKLVDIERQRDELAPHRAKPPCWAHCSFTLEVQTIRMFSSFAHMASTDEFGIVNDSHGPSVTTPANRYPPTYANTNASSLEPGQERDHDSGHNC